MTMVIYTEFKDCQTLNTNGEIPNIITIKLNLEANKVFKSFFFCRKIRRRNFYNSNYLHCAVRQVGISMR